VSQNMNAEVDSSCDPDRTNSDVKKRCCSVTMREKGLRWFDSTTAEDF
jgi:hypothetical protein